MDANRFDALVRALYSRRRAVQTLAGLGAGLGLTRRAEAAVAECLAGGSPCEPGAVATCCSNICKSSKKHKGKFFCAPAGEPFGCTKHDNACSHGGTDTPCPAIPDQTDTFCVNDKKGKPFCGVDGVCAQCTRDADCVGGFGNLARCVKCSPCKHETQGVKTACIVPLTAM
ncbi:MAG TPA: hypothetical protein VFU81_19295 [Thermomicrobiales bacterium]|nr:hypothetical protein [Thermomicrobiales bacterium]